MTIKEILADEKQLPPSPQILPKLLKVLQSDEGTSWEIVELARVDQTLTAQVLAWSNSAFYGFSESCDDLETAISRIGLKELYKLVGMLVSKRLVGKKMACYALDESQLWENSIATAFCMELLANKLGEDPSECYTIGLLHAIGKTIINQCLSNQYEKVFALISEKKISMEDAETAVFGFNHAELGQALLEKWNFPKIISETVGFQFKPLQCTHFTKIACMMHVSNWIVAALGQNHGKDSWAITINEDAFKKLGLTENEIQQTLLDAHEKIDAIKAQLMATSH